MFPCIYNFHAHGCTHVVWLVTVPKYRQKDDTQYLLELPSGTVLRSMMVSAALPCPCGFLVGVGAGLARRTIKR